MSMEKTLVVVLTRNYSTGLSVVRSLGTAGYDVDVIASATSEGKSDIVRSSRYVGRSFESVSRKVGGDGEEELVSELLKYKEILDKKAVLIAADDYTASVMDRNREILNDIFIMPSVGIRNGSLTECMDKSVQGIIAKETGINTPNQWTISLREEIAIPSDICYPCFVKPAQSFLGYKQEMKRCDTSEELKNHLQILQEKYPDRDILVQEFMDIDTEIDIEGVCVDQTIILTGVVIKDIVARYDKGVPLAGRVLSFDEFDGLKEKVEVLLKKYKYIGMFDLGINIIDGQYWFNEINMRSGGTNYAYFCSGVNLPDIFVKAVTGMEINEEDTSIEYGKSYFYENMGWEDYLHEYMSKEEVLGGMEAADILFIENREDPEPARIFNESMQLRIAEHENYIKPFDETAEASGLTRSEAKEVLKEAKERIGISYHDFVKYEFWKYSKEEQERVYSDISEKREKKKLQKEKCIAVSMEEMNWDRETAAAQLKDIRDRIDISLNDYIKIKLYKYSEEKQQGVYDRYVAKKERRKLQREECIAKSMQVMGWDRAEAESKLDDIRGRLQITYVDYLESEIFKVPDNKQEKKYEKYLKSKDKR